MIQITSIEGNRQWLDGGAMFGNAPRTLWEKWTPMDSQGRIPLACRCLLVETEECKLLCEAGIGVFFPQKLASRFGVQDPQEHKLLTQLEKHGVKPEDLDFIILSHLHFDHAGGLLPHHRDIEKGQDDLVFPKATYVVSKKAWERAQNPHMRDKASFIPLLNQKLSESGRLKVISSCQKKPYLPPWISFFESHGHTPGQLHTVIQGNEICVVFAGDLIPGTPWVHLPITMGYDRFPETLVDEKRNFYTKFAHPKCKIFFTHDHKYTLATILKNEKGGFEAVDLEEEFSSMMI